MVRRNGFFRRPSFGVTHLLLLSVIVLCGREKLCGGHLGERLSSAKDIPITSDAALLLILGQHHRSATDRSSFRWPKVPLPENY